MGVATMEVTDGALVYEDSDQKETLLQKLNVLRRNGQFCDTVLIVGEHDLPAHRAVLASVSPYLFDAFSAGGDDKDCQQVKLKGVDFVSFEHLLNYAYTSKLKVPAEDVTGVYKAAHKLRIGEVTEACANYLAQNLTPANCLDIRRFAEDGLRARVDEYICNNFNTVVMGTAMANLPNIHVDFVGADEDILSTSSERQLFQLVVDWAKGHIPEKELHKLTDETFMLYLNADNVLTDCSELSKTDDLNQAEMVQDYKKTSRKLTNANGGGASNGVSSVPHSPNVKRFSIQGGRSPKVREWTVVATSKISSQMFSALSILGSRLVKLRIRLVTDLTNTNPEKPESPKAENFPTLVRKAGEGRQASLVLLEKMSCARCTMGVLVVQDKLIVCGGYDRGECLATVESYHMDTNLWDPLPNMLTPRGRFDVAELDGKLYACGGSNGFVELSTVECYDFKSEKWSYVSSLLGVRSNAGVAVLDGRLYCVGGRTNVSAVNTCEVYDPVEDQWKGIASLNFPRCQASVCKFGRHLVAAGGSDAWNCLSTVEMYDPDTDTWELAAPLNTARRGAASAVLNGKVYVVGGNDGSHSLASVEVYQPLTDSWVMGPPLTTPRANVGAAVLGRNLMAVGGFSGMTFLDTIEYLNEEEDSEWCIYLPIESSVVAEKVREKRQSGELEWKDGENGSTHGNGISNGLSKNGSQIENQSGRENGDVSKTKNPGKICKSKTSINGSTPHILNGKQNGCNDHTPAKENGQSNGIALQERGS